MSFVEPDYPALPARLVKRVHDAARVPTGVARELCGSGRIRVSSRGKLLPLPVDADALVYEDDQVLLDGSPLPGPGRHFYGVLHKPHATLCVPKDPRGKGDLAPWLARVPCGTFAMGRLDRDTTGALLLTTDGDLANVLLRPERAFPKTYLLRVRRRVPAQDERWRTMTLGVDVGPYVAQAAAVRWLGYDGAETFVRVVLTHGRHREIRRLARALELRLSALHRDAVGGVSVAGLAAGTMRELSPSEVEALWGVSGGRSRLEQDRLRALRERATAARAGGRRDARLEAWLRRNEAARNVGAP